MEGEEGGIGWQGVTLAGDKPQIRGAREELSPHSQAESSPVAGRWAGGSHFFGLLKRRKSYWIGRILTSLFSLGLDGIYFGYGVTTALKIVQRSTPFLTRHFASRLGGFTPMNNLPHSRSWSDPYYEETFMKRAQELPESHRVTLCQQDPGVWKKGR